MLQVYNTLSRSIERFETVEPGVVKMYVCGPTVYDYTHVGHARTYIAFDVIKRYLRLRGFDVVHVQNITDIDDKIIRRASEEGVSWEDVAETFTRDYMECLEKLNISVDLHPRVSRHIKEIIEFIQVLIDKGYAYVAPSGSVYFNVDAYDDYGRLSGRREKELWGQEVEFLHEKRNPYDFALWKAAKPGEPYWESPWGPGRPGWHIECSVMSSKYLGKQFDIHGGGTDLIFPHHENERAQSEAALGVRPWVRYWLHTGMVNVRGEKMSKSLGNIVPLKDLFKRFRPEVVRLWLATVHYRRIVDFSEEALEQAERNFERLVAAVSAVKRVLREASPSYSLAEDEIRMLKEMQEIRRGFYEAMDRDFNASAAFSHVYRLTSLAFKLEEKPSYSVAVRALALFEEFNRVMGVLDKHLAEAPPLPFDVNELIRLVIDVRSKLRERKAYDLSDWIRERLLELGIRVSDTREGTKWYIA